MWRALRRFESNLSVRTILHRDFKILHKRSDVIVIYVPWHMAGGQLHVQGLGLKSAVIVLCDF